MKQILALFLLMACFSTFELKAATSTSSNRIQWNTSYENAISLSKSTSKPVLLFFTGSDWCSWCQKLENEVLNTAEFAQEAKDKFIFVKIDFPLNGSLNSTQTDQNKQLQKKYDVHGFPTIIILDGAHQQQVGVTGYRAGGGKQYANHLFKMVNDYSSYQSKLNNLDSKNISENDLKKLYEKAKELGQENEAIALVKLGMEKENNHFFLTERYRFLADEGQIHDQEAVALKQRLLAADPNNKLQTHYQIAVIDFEACCEHMDKENYSADQVISPLKNYIDHFGNEDKENLWRLQTIISQVYFDHNNYSEALKYAQNSHFAAPDSAKPEIALAIKNIQLKISSE